MIGNQYDKSRAEALMVNAVPAEITRLEDVAKRIPNDTVAEHKLITWLLPVFAGETTTFATFQIYNMFPKIFSGSASNTLKNIWIWSENGLLGSALLLVTSELVFRTIQWYNSSEEQRSGARVNLGIAAFKHLTVDLFIANAIYEQLYTPNVAVAKTAGSFFIALFFLDMLASFLGSYSSPSTHYMSTALFTDAIFKAVVFAAAILQFFPETAFAGLVVALVGFVGLTWTVGAIIKHHNDEVACISATAEQQPLRSASRVQDAGSLAGNDRTFWNRVRGIPSFMACRDLPKAPTLRYEDA